MNFWVCTDRRHRTTSVLGRVHAAFFTTHQMQEMIHMPVKIILARMMAALDLEFEKAMHYHVEGYESDNDWAPTQIHKACPHLLSLHN